jgi:hypothetical protein
VRSSAISSSIIAARSRRRTAHVDLAGDCERSPSARTSSSRASVRPTGH